MSPSDRSSVPAAPPRAASPRLVWIANRGQASAEDRILELGCGHGVLLSLLCPLLSEGQAVGLDRSRTMIEQAARRNSIFIDDGRLRLLQRSLEKAELDPESFTRVVAVNFPPLIRGDPTAALRQAAHVLKPGGELRVYSAAAGSVGDRLDPLLERLEEAGFDQGTLVQEEFERWTISEVSAVRG